MRTRLIKKDGPTDLDFKLGGEKMDKIEEYRYLGIVVDSQHNFQSHRHNVINNVDYKLTFFKKIHQFITTEAATVIYKGTILPLFEYADQQR